MGTIYLMMPLYEEEIPWERFLPEFCGNDDGDYYLHHGAEAPSSKYFPYLSVVTVLPHLNLPHQGEKEYKEQWYSPPMVGGIREG